MREETIADKIKQLGEYLTSIKSKQGITGDSWKLYRYSGLYNTSSTGRTFLVFRASNPNAEVTAQLLQPVDNLELSFVGIRHQNGVYFWIIDEYASGSTNRTYRLVATQPGTVSITYTPPF